MKLLLFFTLINLHCFGQDLVGIWQIKTKEVSSAYLETYQFFDDGTYKFNTNQYDGLSRIISIGGKYSIDKTTLILSVEYSIEYCGGHIEKSKVSTLNDAWEIADGEIVRIEAKKKNKEVINLKFDSTNQEKILLNTNNYFRISTNPKDF